jgi:Protein of unknown function (DUF3352)
MKRRSFFTVLAATAAVLLFTGLAGFAWLFSHSPLSLLRGVADPNPQAIIFVPHQAPAMASLLVSPDRLEALQLALVSPNQRRAQRGEFEAWRDGILGGDLSYQRDVKPWLGDEITVAMTSLDLDRESSNGRQPGYLMALTTKNSVRSREFLQLFWQQRASAQTLQVEPFKGTKIIYGQLKNNQPANDLPPVTLASAVVGDRFVLFANSPKVLREAINNVQAVELNLGNDPDYQKNLAALNDRRIGLAYFNWPQLAGINPVSSDAFQTMAVGLGIDRSGLIAHTTMTSTSGAELTQLTQLTQPSPTLKYLPNTASAVISGTHLDRTWQGITQGIAPYRLATNLLENPIQAWSKQWQLDLPKDIFAWVQGDYAMGLLPDSSNWIFAIDKTTNPDYAQGLAKLNARAKERGLAIATVDVAGQSVSAWAKLNTPAIGAWAEVDNNLIFTNSIAAMKTALETSKTSMLQSKAFTQGIDPLERTNSGYLYLDWAKTQPLIAAQFPIVRFLDLVAPSLSKNLKSIAVTSYGEKDAVNRGDVFLRLK